MAATINRTMMGALALASCVMAAAAGPQVATSPDRAKTDLNPGLKRIGTLKPRGANEIQASNWTLGCETLDRDFADYQQYKEYLVPLGIKTIRLQAGWAKTEKVKGIYDFAWLDTIVDDARARGLNILLETGYGNAAYTGGGGTDLSGGFPTSEEALAAWDHWVEAMATHYKGKVRDWAMWNEPDNNKQHKPEDIAAFNIRTAEIIRRVLPDARIAGLSLASSSPTLFESCLKALAARGKVDLFPLVHLPWLRVQPGQLLQERRSVEGDAEKILHAGKNATGRKRLPVRESDEVRALQLSLDGIQPGQVGFAADARRSGARCGVGRLHHLRLQPHRKGDQPQGLAAGHGRQEGGEDQARLLFGAERRGGLRRHA
ncbi:MAG: beta-galactosidase [Verrucomicrobia bacterium]|nr:beta-galactosidase [Verrucomicrobiota bacterium]